MLYWNGNFDKVIDNLTKDFLVAIVAYTGFDKTDTENYISVLEEVKLIEKYIAKNYQSTILAAYGCSLGGTFVAHLTSRHNIHMKYGIIGSSDFDQASNFKANLMSSLMVKITYNFIHTGKYKSKMMQKRYEKQITDKDPYNKAFVSLVGRDKYDMSFISKESLKNQFKSDLVTKLPTQIDNQETKIHVFYAKKMGDKYLKRYKKYFKDPIIHTQDMRHEEFLGVYPNKWCELVKEICLNH